MASAGPFMKWAGGKTQLLPQLEPYFPNRFGTFYEPFLGGAAVFFRLRPRRAILADLNPELINAYVAVRDNLDLLIVALDRHSAHRTDKDYFYRVRAQPANELNGVERAARTIYLNKTCFNGLFRVNSKGQFNVPWGSYKDPKLYDPEGLAASSAALRGKSIVLADYHEACGPARKGDFVYFDPPYHPLSRTSSFTSYTKEDFGEEQQSALAAEVGRLDQLGAKVMLSNSPTPFIRSLYKGYRIATLKARRAINSRGAGRGAIEELLVMNYR